MTELETLLFRTITVGFALLSMTLLTGVLFVEDFFARRLPFFSDGASERRVPRKARRAPRARI